MIGLLVIQALKAAGCTKVIADLADEKLKIAQLGADLGVNPKNTDAVKAIQDATGGRGADIAMEVVGATATVKTAIESTRKGDRSRWSETRAGSEFPTAISGHA